MLPRTAKSTGHNNGRKSVIQRELSWHENEAHRRYSLDALLYDPPAFDAVVTSGLRFLEIADHERVLDVGCGEGKETLALAQHNLCVISTDLSFAQLSRVRQLIKDQYPDANVHFVQANAEELPFAARSFRLIYGKAILHHLDLDLSAQEINRLLQPSGRATFAEPLAHHPLLWLARRLTPHLRTRDEHPITVGELCHFASTFERQQMEVYFLLAPLAYLFRLLPGSEALFQRLHESLQRIDAWLFRVVPPLKHLAWYGLVKLRKLD